MIKKILILGSSAGSLINFRGSFILKLIESGYSVHVCAPELSNSFNEKKWLSEKGVICHDATLSRTGMNPLVDIISLFRLRKIVKKVKPDIFFSYTIKPVIWGTLAAKLCDVPKRVALITGLGYAFTADDRGKRKLVKWIASSLYRLSLKYSHVIFFQNPDDKSDFQELGLLPKGVLVQVVNGSGVDTKRFEFTTPPRARGKIRFLLIARLLADKGIREYAAAAKIIMEKYSNVEFHLVGGLDTNPEALSQEEVELWEQKGYLTWWGAQSDVRPFINNCSIYVLPSYREGTPRTVLEAMAVGRAIITTDAPGCKETVSNGHNGYLVAIKSVEQLVQVMEKFLTQPELIGTMGLRSREIALEKYDVNKVNELMLSVIQMD